MIVEVSLKGSLMIHPKIPIHGSVISNDHQAIIFMGPRKCGKSSTAYLMIERGWNLIADSISYISKINEKYFVEASGKNKFMTFPFPSIFPELNQNENTFEEFSQKHNEMRLFIDSIRIFPGQTDEISQIRLFMFPRLTDQEKSQIFELSPSEAMAIFKQDAWHLHHESYDLTEEDEIFLREMFDHIKCYRLNIGKNWKTFIEELIEMDHIFNTDVQLHR